jgi:hypothetical protein
MAEIRRMGESKFFNMGGSTSQGTAAYKFCFERQKKAFMESSWHLTGLKEGLISALLLDIFHQPFQPKTTYCTTSCAHALQRAEARLR